MTHTEALNEWQKRWDAASGFARFALMVELQGRLRPDIWERNNALTPLPHAFDTFPRK